MKEAYMQSTPNITFAQDKYNITIDPNNECFPKPSNDSFRILKVFFVFWLLYLVFIKSVIVNIF